MSRKETQNGSGRFGGLARGFRAFYSTISDQAFIDAASGIVIIVLLSLLLLRDYQRPEVEALIAGTVASEDMLAPEELRIEDVEETNKLKARAAAAEFPVFDFNPRTTREARNIIEQVFSAGREASPDKSRQELRVEIEAASGVLLDADYLGVLVNHRFNTELQRLMVDHLETVMLSGVMGSRSQLVRLGATGILRRDLRTGHELQVTDLGSIRDLITARAALRSDRMVWPAEYSFHERRLLGELLGSLIVPNLVYNENETEARRSSAQAAIAPVTVVFEKGKPIVTKGEVVTPIKARALEAAASQRPIGQRAVEFGGTVIIVMLLVLVLWQYLLRYQRRHMRVRRHFLLQIATFIVTLGLARLFYSFGGVMTQWFTYAPFNSEMGYLYLAPLAVGAALVTILTDAHAAFVFSAILAVFVGVFSGNVYLAAYTLLSSVGAIYHLQNCRDRTALVRAGLWVGVINSAAALALDLLGANEPRLDLILFDVFCGFVSGLLAAMVASIFLTFFEWAFEITTNIKLLELSNLNLPLLKQLAERAPGTYHHSIMVGLLAEAGAEAIGGDALFARVACYYHDIGKMVRPTYFVENQTYMDNRHDGLSPKMSSIVLANHVKQGIELARQYKLPPRIISIIPQHHGTGLMKYFYFKARKAAGDNDSRSLEQEFRYPGPKPQTREAAIIMIADSVEAAARTIESPSPTKLRNMIDTIISRIRDDGQFDECDITLRELRIVAESFVKVLMGIHHHRIAYPGYDFNKAGATSTLPDVSPRQSGSVSDAAPVAPSAEAASSQYWEARGD